MPVFDQQHASWIKHIGRDQPTVTCQLICGKKSITIRGILNTGANVTVISYIFWPQEWKLVAPLRSLTGTRGSSLCLQSENTVVVTGPGDKTAIIHPFIVQKPITHQQGGASAKVPLGGSSTRPEELADYLPMVSKDNPHGPEDGISNYYESKDQVADNVRKPKWMSARHMKPYWTQMQADTDPGNKEASTQMEADDEAVNISSINI
ncbi:endogenous retrovirus group K member 6 Pro protein-like [Geospiza fortis]|uniref:Endogenous retrovirus group K member 6 Pro protein-like n=1 Tax=Geospiza fortis TaxID=48883 RepID=A0A6I9Z5I9_GEOFO|nr:endogenous retrovirus group K member 6 Pro protein-like [Geospiza fortis]